MNRRLTAQERAQVAARYAAGERPRDIAPDFGISSQSVRRIADRAGVPAQRRACPGGLLEEARQKELAARYAAGEASYALAAEYDVSPRTAVTYAQKHGVPVRHSHVRLTAAQQAEIVAANEAGVSRADLAARYGVTPQTIINTVRRAGARPVPKPRPRKLTDDEVAVLVARYEAEPNQTALAREFGVARETVHLALLRAGVELGPPVRGRSSWTWQQEAEAVARHAAGEAAVALAAEYGVSPSTMWRAARLYRQGVRRSVGTLTDAEKQQIAARYAAGEWPGVIGADAGLAANDVARIARAAGVPAQRQGASLTDAQKAHIEARYAAGASAAELSRETGRSGHIVARHLKTVGLWAAPQALTPEREAEVVRRYVEGQEGAPAIAAAIGTTPDRVRSSLQRKGVQLRPGGSLRPQLTPDEQAVLVARYQADTGLTAQTVAAEFGVTDRMAARILEAHGVPRRRRPKPGGVR
ncbi:MAG: hypothetical protein QM628_15555 [Propionicimonas sp.]